MLRVVKGVVDVAQDAEDVAIVIYKDGGVH